MHASLPRVHGNATASARPTVGCFPTALRLVGWLASVGGLLALALVPPLAAQSVETTRGQEVISATKAVPVYTSPPIIPADFTDLMVSRSGASIGEDEILVDTLIGSLRFGVFGIGRTLFGDPAIAEILMPIEMATPFAFGGPAGTNPSEGLLFWSGSAFARDIGGTQTDGHAVIGDVEISIASYADPHANISFFDLFDVNTGASRASFGWTDLPVQDGVFGSSYGPESNGVRATFFGPSHAGVGGVFQHDGLIGAFGAQRAHAEALPGPAVADSFPIYGDPATWLLDVVLGGPPSVNNPSLQFATAMSMLSLTDDMSTLIDDISPLPEELPGVEVVLGEMSLSVRGVVGGSAGDHGEFALTTRMSTGLAELPIAVEFNLVGFAGEDGQAGYSVLNSWGELDLGEGILPFVDGELFPVEESLPIIGGFGSKSLTAGGYGALTNPTQGVARWDGVLRAEDISDSRSQGNRVSGNVAISVDLLSRPEVNVEFFNLVDQDFGRSLENISWTAIPVSKGNFIVEDGVNLLQGAFAGLENTSVAGIFQWDDLSGGFVASQIIRPDPLLPVGQDARYPSGQDVQVLVSLPSVDADFGADASITAVSTIEGLLRSSRQTELGEAGVPGVEIERLRLVDASIKGIASDVDGFGGWLEEGYFAVAGIHRADGDLGQRRWASAALLVGSGSTTNPPDVNATWTGEMVGIDISGTAVDGNLVRGSATVTLRSALYLEATVAFREILDVATGWTRPDMWWGGIPVFDGRFGSATSNAQIEGQFFGTDQREVAGTFEWRMIQGAFGARIAEP